MCGQVTFHEGDGDQKGARTTTTPSAGDITQLLQAWSDGNGQALDELMPVVHAELRRLASRYLHGERPDHTLQATALVNEAYLRLVDQHDVRWQNRAHFFGIAARIMRHILVDHARKRQAAKRGGGETRVSFDEALGATRDVDLVALDEALESLAALNARQSQIVELRFFGGLSIAETAEVLRVSPATVKNDWTAAKARLYLELTRG